MKKISIFVASLMCLQLAHANQILLDQKEIDLGNLSNIETNTSVDKIVSFKRTDATPKKVKLKFAFNSLQKDCVDFEVKVEEIPESKKIVCEASNGGSFVCEEKIFSGLYNAKTVCASEGLTRVENQNEITLNFAKAVKLAPEASEVVSISIQQSDMNSDKTEIKGQVDQSHSLNKVKNSPFGNLIIFKAL